MSVELTPILTKFWDDPQSWTLQTYEDNEGYRALRQAVGMTQAELVDMTKDSGLRGRGGAGFPTGLKWSFLPPPDGGPRYLVVNADESEPGTCKDIPLMMAAPHFLIEGVAITSYAIGCNHAFIYVRGEVVHVYRRLLRAVEEAYAAGYLGKNILGTGFDLEVTVHAGAGAYICGEETALLDSLEGRRGQPRLKPPFPAVAGLYARPTVVNNVESIASIPPILLHGSDWFKGMGSEKSTGFGIFSLSGHVKRPGQFEAPLGITLRELLDMAGGMRDPQHVGQPKGTIMKNIALSTQTNLINLQMETPAKKTLLYQVDIMSSMKQLAGTNKEIGNIAITPKDGVLYAEIYNRKNYPPKISIIKDSTILDVFDSENKYRILGVDNESRLYLGEESVTGIKSIVTAVVTKDTKSTTKIIEDPATESKQQKTYYYTAITSKDISPVMDLTNTVQPDKIHIFNDGMILIDNQPDTNNVTIYRNGVAVKKVSIGTGKKEVLLYNKYLALLKGNSNANELTIYNLDANK